MRRVTHVPIPHIVLGWVAPVLLLVSCGSTNEALNPIEAGKPDTSAGETGPGSEAGLETGAPDGTVVVEAGPSEAGMPDGAKAMVACATCHVEYTTKFAASKHANVEKGCVTCHDGAEAHSQDPGSVKAKVDFSLELCGTCHAPHKETYLQDDNKAPSEYGGKYGGSKKTSKYLDFPKYQYLMGGHGFTKEYGEERAHKYALLDHIETKRTQNAVCLQCKSTPVAYYWNEARRGAPTFGKELAWDKTVEKIKAEWPTTIDHGTACSHCHDPHGTSFRLVRKALLEAIMERGTEPYSTDKNFVPKSEGELNAKMNEKGADGKLTSGAKRLAGILTCAQCHIEYTCGPGVDKTTTGNLRDEVPWRKLRDLEGYYMAKFGNVQDWKHSITETNGIKAQHPETEFFWESKHYLMGASCADCHLTKSSATSTSHWFTSPLKHPQAACGSCHTDATDRAKKVVEIQTGIMTTATDVENELEVVLKRIEAVKADPAFDPAKLAQAKDYFMRALFWWEFTVVSENSAGFHNPTEAATNLQKAKSELALARPLLGILGGSS